MGFGMRVSICGWAKPRPHVRCRGVRTSGRVLRRGGAGRAQRCTRPCPRVDVRQGTQPGRRSSSPRPSSCFVQHCVQRVLSRTNEFPIVSSRERVFVTAGVGEVAEADEKVTDDLWSAGSQLARSRRVRLGCGADVATVGHHGVRGDEVHLLPLRAGRDRAEPFDGFVVLRR